MIVEENLVNANNNDNLSKLNCINAQYIRYMKIEHSLLHPKTNLHRLKEGDANSKYFHGLLRGKGRRMFMHKLLTDNGQWFKVMIILLMKLANILNIFSLQTLRALVRICYIVFLTLSLLRKILF